MNSGARTCDTFCAICCSAIAFGNDSLGTSSATQACLAGPMNANPSPITRVARVRMGTVMCSVMMRMPVTRITVAGTAWPASTRGFLRIRSAITPPIGDTVSMAMPEPIWANPAAALLPEILNATLGTSMNDIMNALVATRDPDHSIR